MATVAVRASDVDERSGVPFAASEDRAGRYQAPAGGDAKAQRPAARVGEHVNPCRQAHINFFAAPVGSASGCRLYESEWGHDGGGW